MKCVRKCFLLSFALLLLKTVKSQPSADTKVYADGYLIYLRPNWVFQPCADSTVDLLTGMNATSFVPGTFPLSFGVHLLPLEGFGNKRPLKYYNGFLDSMQEDTVFYFFCRIKLLLSADTSMNEDLRPCRYTIYHRGKRYDLGCKYLLNAIEWVRPYNSTDRLTYLDYLKSQHYPLPDWALDTCDAAGRCYPPEDERESPLDAGNKR